MSEQSHVTSTESDDFHNLRIGYPDRANLMPLLYGLQAGWVGPPSPWKLEVTHAAPRALVAGLLEGTLDAAFVPPLSLSGGSSQLASLGGWGMASEGKGETARLLQLLSKRRFASHLEIETYTWDILPPGLKRDLVGSIAEEYRWVLRQMRPFRQTS
mgnify:CR=1 FL=1